MQEIKFSLPTSESITLTGQEVDKLIRAGDGDAALLYIYIRKTGGQRSDLEAAKDLDKDKGWVASALAVLSKLGLVQIDKSSDLSRGINHKVHSDEGTLKPLAEPRQYTESEVTREIASDSNFSRLVEETQGRLGKILSPDELLRLFSIYDNLRMPPEVIFQLITHCISESRRSGDGRAPSLRYIEKAAFTWEREGVFTLERAEEYLKELEKHRDVRGQIQKAINIKGRGLSATEKKYVDGWIKLGIEPEAIAIAYDKTVIKTGTMSWPYIDKIIRNWHSKGLLTAKQVAEMEGKPGSGTSKSDTRAGTQQRGKFDAGHGEPSREEIERMQRVLDRIKSGKETS